MSVAIPCGRIRADLTKSTFMRGQADVAVAGASTSYLDVQYSLDNGASWSADIGVAVPLSAVRHSVGPSVAIPSPARTNVLLRAVAGGGDGSSPEIFNFLVVATSAEPPAATPPAGLFDALFLSHIGTFTDVARTTAVDTNGATIGGWENQIAGSTVHGEQATTANAPIVDTGELVNGYRTIRFSAGVQINFLSLFSGATEGTLLIIAKNDFDPPTGSVFGSNSGLWHFGASGASTQVTDPAGGILKDIAMTTAFKNTGVVPPTPIDEWFCYAVRSKNGNYSCWWDGAEVFSTGTNTFAAGAAGGGGSLGIGAVPNDHWEGNVACLAMKTAWLDDTAIAAAITELMVFYGLA